MQVPNLMQDPFGINKPIDKKIKTINVMKPDGSIEIVTIIVTD